MDEAEYIECRIFNGAIYALTASGDLYQLRHTVKNIPEIILAVAGGASPFRWPEWLRDAPSAKETT